MKAFRTVLQVLLPLLVLSAGYLAAKTIAARAAKPVVTPPAARGPLVRAATVERADLRLDVETQGTVEPLRTVELGADVTGRIVSTSPSLRVGGSFARDEVLATIDATDFDLAIVQQEAAVARAELHLLQERAEADAAVRAWKQLEGDRKADPLVTRGPQIADAERSLAATRAALERARLDRARTEVRAPFAGRVRSVQADVGSRVQAGQAIAVVFDVEAAEVRLPLPASDAAFVDLPFAGNASADAATPVTFTAQFAGRRHEWQGRIVRTDGEIDRRSRQLTAIARIEAPYAPRDGRPPLLVGKFVHATIQGRTFPGVLVVPRAALRNGNEVQVIDAERRLRRRPVRVLRTDAARALLAEGVEAGEMVCITDVEGASDGMIVRLADDPKPTPTGGATPPAAEAR